LDFDREIGMTTICTTLQHVHDYGCLSEEGWERLLAHLGKACADDEPLPYAVILESIGLEDALACCRAEPGYAKEWMLFAVRCARRFQHRMTDPRSIHAIDVAERYANGGASDEELADARDAALSAAGVAADAVERSAAWVVALAADRTAALAAARVSAGLVAWSAAWNAEQSAGWMAASSVALLEDERSVALQAARIVAATTELAANTAEFLRVVGEA